MQTPTQTIAEKKKAMALKRVAYNKTYQAKLKEKCNKLVNEPQAAAAVAENEAVSTAAVDVAKESSSLALVLEMMAELKKEISHIRSMNEDVLDRFKAIQKVYDENQAMENALIQEQEQEEEVEVQEEEEPAPVDAAAPIDEAPAVDEPAPTADNNDDVSQVSSISESSSFKNLTFLHSGPNYRLSIRIQNALFEKPATAPIFRPILSEMMTYMAGVKTEHDYLGCGKHQYYSLIVSLMAAGKSPNPLLAFIEEKSLDSNIYLFILELVQMECVASLLTNEVRGYWSALCESRINPPPVKRKFKIINKKSVVK